MKKGSKPSKNPAKLKRFLSIAFTLLELIVVIVIIAILAVISFPKFSTMRESSVEQEAIANLKLIQTAEKIYKMETGYYYPYCISPPCSEDRISEIDDHLKLAIPSVGINWDYKIVDASSAAFTGKAKRTTNTTRVKCVDKDNEPSDCNGTW